MVHDITNKTDLLFIKGQASERPDPARTKAEAAATAATQHRPVDRAELERAVAKVRDVVQKAESRFEIEIDSDLDRVIVKILSGTSGEVIRQIPPKEFLELAKQFADPKGLLGLLLKERA